jgi:hypothetical protein
MSEKTVMWALILITVGLLVFWTICLMAVLDPGLFDLIGSSPRYISECVNQSQ